MLLYPFHWAIKIFNTYLTTVYKKEIQFERTRYESFGVQFLFTLIGIAFSGGPWI
jgi:hypothetical protein